LRRAARSTGESPRPPEIAGTPCSVNIRLRPDQEERINAIVERSAILDTSKFVRIAVDWLLRSDIGEVIKTIVDDEAFKGSTSRSNQSGVHPSPAHLSWNCRLTVRETELVFQEANLGRKQEDKS
jgi:hypothetical protein